MLKRVTVVLVACLLVGIAFGASPAGADPTHSATLQWPLQNGQIYLNSSPHSGGGQATIQRDIYLAADTYTWDLIVGLPNSDVAEFSTRTIYLSPGTYHWQCWLTQQNGYYDMNCSLNNGVTTPAYLPAHRLYPLNYYPAPGGYYYFGSRLNGAP